MKTDSYPKAFISKEGCIIYRGKDKSNDGSPRFIINPNSVAEYAISTLLEDGWLPINTAHELKIAKIIENSKSN